MTSQTRDRGAWQQIRGILDQALERPPGQRTSYVEQACPDSELRRRVHSVLDAYESATDPFPASIRPRVSALQDIYGPGSEIGPYKLEKSLGTGGMGTVFLARRSDQSFDKQVAIKLLKRQWASDEEVIRFKRERQILADLVHPKIGQLLDGGNTPQGHPFLVMEYVEGQTLDSYCRDHPMNLDEKLSLFLQICSAVQFAHQNLIVHRDLKPGNILVSHSGEVKLLDFGIAKILDDSDFAMTVIETRTGSSPMTLAYASPEQLKGEPVTTATDVYSLGILLYQILTGEKPYSFDGRNLPAAVDAICNQEITAPSEDVKKATAKGTETASSPTPWREIQGDLDAIVLKALSKEPSQRYASAEQFSDDLVRFRTWQPVRAREGTLVYRARKFFHRNRLALAATATIFLILLTSIFALLRQQSLLILQRNQAELVSEWMMEVFRVPDPSRSEGESITARELLDKSRKTIREDLKTQPSLLKRMLRILGQTYKNLGLYDEAEGLTEDALALSRQQGTTTETIELLVDLATIKRWNGKIPPSFELASEATRLAENELPEQSPLRATSLSVQGFAALGLGRIDEADQLLERAEQVARESDDIKVLSEVLYNYFFVRQSQDRRMEAQNIAKEALALKQEFLKASDPRILVLEQMAAFNTVLKGEDLQTGMPRLLEIIEEQKRLYDQDSVLVANSFSTLARTAVEAGFLEESKRLAEEAIRIGESNWGDSHPELALYLSQLGRAELMLGQISEAKHHYERTLAIAGHELGEESFLYGVALAQLAKIENRSGQPAEAEQLAKRALELFEATLGPNHSWVQRVLDRLGRARQLQGDLEGAKKMAQEAVARGRQAPERSRDLSTIIFNLGYYEYKLDEFESAAEHFKEVWNHEQTESDTGPRALTYLGFAYQNLQRWQDAEREGRRAMEAWEAFKGHDGWKVASLETTAFAIVELARPKEAIPMLEQALARRKALGSPESRLEKTQVALDRAKAMTVSRVGS